MDNFPHELLIPDDHLTLSAATGYVPAYNHIPYMRFTVAAVRYSLHKPQPR